MTGALSDLLGASLATMRQSNQSAAETPSSNGQSDAGFSHILGDLAEMRDAAALETNDKEDEPPKVRPSFSLQFLTMNQLAPPLAATPAPAAGDVLGAPFKERETSSGAVEEGTTRSKDKAQTDDQWAQEQALAGRDLAQAGSLPPVVMPSGIVKSSEAARSLSAEEPASRSSASSQAPAPSLSQAPAASPQQAGAAPPLQAPPAPPPQAPSTPPPVIPPNLASSPFQPLSGAGPSTPASPLSSRSKTLDAPVAATQGPSNMRPASQPSPSARNAVVTAPQPTAAPEPRLEEPAEKENKIEFSSGLEEGSRQERMDAASTQSASASDTASATPIRIRVSEIATHLPAVVTQILTEPLAKDSQKSAAAPQLSRGIEQPPEERAEPLKILKFHVEPESLGAITVRMKVLHARVEVKLEAESTQTSALLMEAKSHFSSAISEKGLTLDSFNVTLAPQAGSAAARMEGGGASDRQEAGYTGERGFYNDERPEQRQREDAPARHRQRREERSAPIGPVGVIL